MNISKRGTKKFLKLLSDDTKLIISLSTDLSKI